MTTKSQRLIFGGIAFTAIALALWLMQITEKRVASELAKPTALDSLATDQGSSFAMVNTGAMSQQSKPEFREGSDFTAIDRKGMQEIQFRFTAGDYDAALKLAQKFQEEKEHSASFQNWLTEQMPALLLSSAWFKIHNQNCDGALPLFEQAQRYRRTSEGDKGLAYCFYQLKQTRTAIEYLQQYLEVSPKDRDMLLVFADALETEGRFLDAAAAIERVEAADESPAQDENLEKRRRSLKERAKEGQQQLTLGTKHFLVTYRTPDHDDLASPIAELLELAVDEFIDDYSFLEPKGTIEVVLYPHESFSKVVQYGPEWAQGLFDGRMRIPVRPGMTMTDDDHALARVLRHELVHALFANMLPPSQALPPWFNEGLAQRLECRQPCNQSRRPPQRGTFLDPEVFIKPYTSYAADLAKRSYEQSLYLVGIVENGLEREDTLRLIVQNIGRGVTSVDSDTLLRPVGVTFPELHQLAKQSWR